MLKNTSGQSLLVFAFAKRDVTIDGTPFLANDPVTGIAATITCKLALDDGARNATTDVNPEEKEDGQYLFTLTKAETNADTIDPFPESSNADVAVIALYHNRYTTAVTSSASSATASDGDVPFDLVGPAISVATEGVIAVDSSGSISVAVGSTQSVAITCNQDVSTSTLVFTVETKAKVDVASVADGSITKDEDVATLSLTSAMTSSERTLRWSLCKTSNGESVAGGLMFVSYDAQGDA